MKKLPFRAKHQAQERTSDSYILKKRIDDLEERFDRLVGLLARYGTAYSNSSKLIMQARREGKL